MKRGETAHRQPAHVRFRRFEVAEDVADVVARTRLRILLRIVGHVGGWIAARAEGDAAVEAREEPHLRLPAAVIAGVLVDEDERRPLAAFLVVKADGVVRGCVRHASPGRRMASWWP